METVLDYLNNPRLVPFCHAWRQNIGVSRYLNGRGGYDFVKYGKPGMADISGILRGFRLEVECKVPGEKPNEKQLTWLEGICLLGGIGFWCDSIDTLEERLIEVHAQRHWRWHGRLVVPQELQGLE